MSEIILNQADREQALFNLCRRDAENAFRVIMKPFIGEESKKAFEKTVTKFLEIYDNPETK